MVSSLSRNALSGVAAGVFDVTKCMPNRSYNSTCSVLFIYDCSFAHQAFVFQPPPPIRRNALQKYVSRRQKAFIETEVRLFLHRYYPWASMNPVMKPTVARECLTSLSGDDM